MNMRFKKAGSGFLLTVLTLAVFAASSAVLMQVFLNLSRATGNISTASAAAAIADQGIQEGLLRYDLWAKSSYNTLDVCGEYGDGASVPGSATILCNFSVQPYSLMPYRQGYLDAGCTILSDPAKPANFRGNPNCPYYDLAVRENVLINQSSPQYIYPLNAIASGPTGQTTLRVGAHVGRTHHFSFVLSVIPSTGSTPGSYAYSCSAGCDGTTGGVISAAMPMTVTSTIGYVTFALNAANANGARIAIRQDSLAVPPRSFVVEKGFTTIESTGYAGGIKQTKLLNIYDKTSANPPSAWPNIPKLERQTAQTYGPNGCFVYSVPAPSTCSAQ